MEKIENGMFVMTFQSKTGLKGTLTGALASNGYVIALSYAFVAPVFVIQLRLHKRLNLALLGSLAYLKKMSFVLSFRYSQTTPRWRKSLLVSLEHIQTYPEILVECSDDIHKDRRNETTDECSFLLSLGISALQFTNLLYQQAETATLLHPRNGVLVTNTSEFQTQLFTITLTQCSIKKHLALL